MSTITADPDVLVRLGITAPQDVATTRALPGRALCFQIELHDGQLLFVKQDRAGRAETDAAAEAEAVRRLRAAGLVEPTPEVLAVTPGTGVYRGYQNLPSLGDRTLLGPAGAHALGRALGQLHHTCADLAPTGPLGRPTLDWITVTPRSVAMYPSGYREVWARAARAHEPLSVLAHEWRDSAVIHGDIKADNVLLTPDPVRAVLLDWETTGRGDPMWDLGCALGDRVWAWLLALPLTPGASLTGWLTESSTPFDEVSADLRTLVEAYAAAVEPVRIAAYAGAFLLQRALADGMQTERLPAHGLLCTHLATEFLTRPDDIAEILL